MSILLADIDATCAALGYSDGERYIAEPDVVQGLKHLIWILRHDLDNHEYRRHMGRAKVLQTDLVCMLPDYINDDDLADILIRLLVILSNPIMLLYREGPPKDNHGRKVYLELIDILQGYKNAFANDAIWGALCIKLKKSFEVDWALRSEDETLLIERILVLMRNVLQVPAYAEAECRTDNDASVHDRVIWAMHQSGMLNLLLFIISSPDEHQFHLHGLEILCLLYREQTAESLADASLQRSTSEKQRDEQELIAVRRREKQRQQIRPPPARHSRFGGTYVIRNMKSVSDRDIICHQPLERVVAMDFDREKQKQKASFRHIREEAQSTRRSAFSVRLCLREFCNEVLSSAYNTLVRQVRKVLERNSGTSGNDDSYLLWAIRFFMEFNRLRGLQLQLVSESLSVQCFHWVLMRMQHNMDMIMSDKKQARVWAKRLHVGLQTFRELLQSLLALQKLQDGNAQALFDMLLNNVCYVLEYRETILHLLMNYNESHSTKAYLRDVVETAHIFIKIMEKFCKDTVLVQDKKRQRKKHAKKSTAANNKKQIKTKEELELEFADKWATIAGEVSKCLNSDIELPEEQQIVPFDATSEKNIDDQSEDCMSKIHKLLHAEKLPEAICLLRAAREVWPENDTFGAFNASPDDEFLLLREIYIQVISTVDETIEPNENPSNESEKSDEDENENEEEYGDEDAGIVEKTFKFDDFAKRLVNGKIVRACTVVLTDWLQIPTRSLKAAVTILHRIAYGCACPAMLYQAKLFRIFQQVLHSTRDQHSEELRRLAIYVIRKFSQIAPNNPKIYAELLFYKNAREANEVETGYCDDYDAGTKGAWTEQEEEELRFLFEENQRNPETDKDVIDWMLDNLLNKTRTRRGVLKKLRDMGLMFKAPTRKSVAAAVNKNLWPKEQDEELRSLYDQYRLEDDCLQRIVTEFVDRRNKQQIIKRMLQLGMIADKSEILPAKPTKSRSKNKKQKGDVLEEGNYMEEPTSSRAGKPKKARPPKQRKVARTPLDVGIVKGLIAQIDGEKYTGALEWLKECLEDAVEDTEEPLEDDDGVPLLPLLEVQKEAMEDANFKKLLIALGMQPPITGIENYWRIPTYLNAADIKKRAKIVGGEELELDVDEPDAAEENDTSEAESVESEEEDYLEKMQREKMNLLMFTKSDEEDELRGGTLASKVKETLKKNFDVVNSDESEDEVATVKLIAKKLRKKRQNPDISSSEDEAEITEEKRNSAFDQLKVKRAKSKENKPINENTTSNEPTMDDSEHEDVAEIEKKLKRKLRQPDAISSDEQEQLDDLFERLRKQTEKSISETDKTKKKKMVSKDFALSVEEKSALLKIQENDEDFVDDENGQQDKMIRMTNKKEAYAASLIDSDGAADTTTKTDADDTTSNQSVNNVEVNNKRQRSPSASVNTASDSDLSNENNDENVNVNDEIASNMRRSYGKRRRLNVIDDDDDDD